ncbi:type VI secretion system contractile sheath large subunit [Kangiella shandongensis]|uniref:type VI secretion system contractile sheath large subunit n=1 Tax=Kangiella shandongensis TaxID=2763258 RepID=UPI001CBAB9B7|nr:type VI secretion system contractile sheath large subunit [Kangiella shandongensis]
MQKNNDKAIAQLSSQIKSQIHGEAEAIGAQGDGFDWERIEIQLQIMVLKIDKKINRLVNAIIHHPRFQELEANWRGLYFLCCERALERSARATKIKLLDISLAQLGKDLSRAIDFDQSEIFKKVYSEEYDNPGGEPYSLLLGSYRMRLKPRPEVGISDIEILQLMSSVAAAAFAPFLTSLEPSFFGVDRYKELSPLMNVSDMMRQPEYRAWNSLRDSEDARFLGIVLPDILMRRRYQDDGTRADGFVFKESIEQPSDRLWGNAIYAFATTVMRAFSEHGWFASIRGVSRGQINGGVVTDLPVELSPVDGETPVSPIAVSITDSLEQQLHSHGFIPATAMARTPYIGFYGNNSVQKPAVYKDSVATTNAAMSSMMQYTLCVSRFAHYIKVICREKVGSFINETECEQFLQQWLLKYTTANDDASVEIKAKYPLREAKVSVAERPDKPGYMLCDMHIRPHFQLDNLTSSIQLTTEIVQSKRGA